MKMVLRNNSDPVMELDIILHPAYCAIRDYKVLAYNLLPRGLKLALKPEYTKAERMQYIATWLMCRAIPNWRLNVYDSTLSLYHMKHRDDDNIVGYQHTASVLSYYASWFDRYTIAPYKTEFICYVFEDHQFHNLYNLKPVDLNTVRGLRKKPDSELDRCLKQRTQEILRFHGSFHSLSMTVRSEMPSWWESNERGVYLAQDCRAKKDKMNVFFEICDECGAPELRESDGNIFKTYYRACDDVVWLSEAMPYLKEGVEVWPQIDELLCYSEEEEDALIWLQEFSDKMQASDFFMDACELGIGYERGHAFPIVIY